MSDTTHATQTEEGATQMTTTEAPTYQVQAIYQLQVGHYWAAFREAESIGRKYYCSEDLSKLAQQMMAKNHIRDALSTYALAAHCWRQTLREYDEINNKTRAEDARKSFRYLLLQWIKAWHQNGLGSQELQKTVLPLYAEHIDLLRKTVLYFKEDVKDVVEYGRLALVLGEGLSSLGQLHWQYDPNNIAALTICQEGAQLLEDIAADGGAVDPVVLTRAWTTLATVKAAFQA